MTAKNFTTEFLNFLKSLQPPFDFGIQRFDGISEHSFSTPNGGWNSKDFPGFHFTSVEDSLLITSIPDTGKQYSYLVVESFNSEGQLANVDLEKKLIEQNGRTTIIEKFDMTVGHVRKRQTEVENTFRNYGFVGNTIVSFEDSNFDWQKILESILEWACLRNKVKQFFQKNSELDGINKLQVYDKSVGINSSNYALNTILYGPPGTGKTYNTVEKAIKIANSNFNFKTLEGKLKDRKDIKIEFDRLVSERQIAFTTFHQSMSYEDFIEGIKPQKPQVGESLKYDIQDGIFKSLSKIAQSNYELSKNIYKKNHFFRRCF